jgi:predicted phage terminase large subunit-like protein
MPTTIEPNLWLGPANPELAGLMATFRRTILENPFIPIIAPTAERDGRPSRRQTQFLAYGGREAFLGGALGGGKTDALLMGALQYAEVPGYSALIIRRTLKMLAQDGGLIPRSKEWLSGKATFHATNHRWTFPSGATLQFGFLDQEKHLRNFDGGAYQYIAADEAQQFPEQWINYLFQRLRGPKDPANPLSRVPLRMRLTGMPGGPGHEWLKQRFISPGAKKFFVPSKLADNPGLDANNYIKSLVNLDPIALRQRLDGDWDAYEGGRFKASWFRSFYAARNASGIPCYYLGDDKQEVPVHRCFTVVICDPACTEKDVDEAGDADPTAIGVFAVTPSYDVLVLHMYRDWIDIDKIPIKIEELCRQYAPSWIGIEDNGFAIGITRACQRMGLTVKSLSPEGKGKLVRATPAVIRAANGQIYLPVKGTPAWDRKTGWAPNFVSELVQFTGQEKLDAHDDQVDVLAYCVQAIQRFGLGGALVVYQMEDEAWDEPTSSYGGMVWKKSSAVTPVAVQVAPNARSHDYGGLVGWRRLTHIEPDETEEVVNEHPELGQIIPS